MLMERVLKENVNIKFFLFVEQLNLYVSFVFVFSTMAVPPSYSDLGKAAKDIFSKGYGQYCFIFCRKRSVEIPEIHSVVNPGVSM